MMASKNLNIDCGDSYIPTATQMIDEDVTYKWDFSREASRRGTTVSSAAWTKQSGDTVTIANAALASSVASAEITGGNRGISIIKTVCTFADGTKSAKMLKITVLDPQDDGVNTY